MKENTNKFPEFDTVLVRNKIEQAKQIIITAHKSPDGDAVGSSMALWNVLKEKGKNVSVVFPDHFPENLNWMNGTAASFYYDTDTTKVKELFKQADLVFCLDYNHFNRTGNLQDELKNSKAFKIMIDHHPDPSNETDVLISSTDECATAQMIYQFVELIGLKSFLTVAAAECIYCGLMTDTGSFRFSSVKEKTHRIVVDLMAIGLDHAKVHMAVFDNDSEDRLRLTGYAISEKLKVLHQYGAAYFLLTAEELKRFNYKDGNTEGLVNYGLAIKGIKMAAIFIERENQIKISFRSKGTLPVNKFSNSFFNGGGHTNAAGGSLKCNLLEAETLFLDKLPQFIKENEN